MKINCSFAIGLLCLSGCSYQSQVVRLNPALPGVAAGNAPSAEQKVLLRIQDSRSSREIGYRAGGDGKASITTEQNVADVLQTKITDILRARGFRAADDGTANSPVLFVELKELSYTVFTEAKTRKVKIRAKLKALAKKDAAYLEKSFEASQERKIPFEPTAKSNEDWINETLSDLLQEFTRDEKVFSFLGATGTLAP